MRSGEQEQRVDRAGSGGLGKDAALFLSGAHGGHSSASSPLA